MNNIFSKTYRSRKPHTIKQLCKIYKKDINNNSNNKLYNACVNNQYCRKRKCNINNISVDNKFKLAQIKKLGANYNTLLMASIHSKCPATMPDKSRKRCYNKAMLKFYKDHELDTEYNNVLACDKTCANEKQTFHKHLFLMRGKHKQRTKKHNKIINVKDLPDNEMIKIM